MNNRVFWAMILWGLLSGFMGFSVVTSIKGTIVWFIGTILVIVLTWKKD